MREEKRCSSLGFVSGNWDKDEEEEKAAKELSEKHLETTSLEEIWCSSGFSAAGEKQSGYSTFVLIVENNFENNQAQYDIQLEDHLNT